MDLKDARAAWRVSLRGMGVNLLLFLCKGGCGLLAGSAGLVSDAFHSLSDLFSTAVVMLGIRLSSKPADRGHPYGHEKIESLAAFLVGLILFGVGLAIGLDGALRLFSRGSGPVGAGVLNTAAILTAALSIACKEWMYRFTMRCAKRIGSAALAADAWHHRSDALSSVGSLAGVVGIRLGFPAVDAAACLVIALWILKAAWDISADACRRMVDAACPPEVVEQIERRVRSNREVLSLDALKTRLYGSKIYADLEITVDRGVSFEHAHAVAQAVHDDLERAIGPMKHCMVHVNPSGLVGHHHI